MLSAVLPVESRMALLMMPMLWRIALSLYFAFARNRSCETLLYFAPRMRP